MTTDNKVGLWRDVILFFFLGRVWTEFRRHIYRIFATTAVEIWNRTALTKGV